MALVKYKTERGHDKSKAGKSWDGRKIEKEVSKQVRRLNDKEVVKKELEEAGK